MRPKSPNYYQKNIMVKRILLSIVLLLVIAYLVVAVTAFNRKPTSQVCQDVELVIKDTVYAGFITKKEVATLLEKKGISPVGKDLERVRTKTLERELAKHPRIARQEHRVSAPCRRPSYLFRQDCRIREEAETCKGILRKRIEPGGLEQILPYQR